MTSTSTRPRPMRIRTYVIAALVSVAAALGILAVSNDWFSSSPSMAEAPALELSLGAGDSLASCIQFDVAALAQMPVAFAGTATAVDGDAITVAVDHWFRGGDAAAVQLSAPQGMEALIGGIAFAEGDQYLITATDGNVNYCGFTGPATPELRSAFDEAFAG